MQIIVNADDFGMNENTTMAIAECFKWGIVNRTTAMVNMPWFKNAIEIARRDGFADRVGLHINLTEGAPLSEEIRESRFWCDADGSFRGGLWRNKLWRFWLPQEAIRLAEIEIEKQMKTFIESGLPLRHFDSHQYICTYWPMVNISCTMASRNGFVSTRGFFNAPRRQFYCKHVNKCIDKHKLDRPDLLLFTKDIPHLASMNLATAQVEIHCHPNKRNANGVYDMDGELMDWTTPYENSLGLCLDILKVHSQC